MQYITVQFACTFIFKSGYGTLIVFMVSLFVSVKRCTVLHLISQSGLIMVNSMSDKEYYVRTYCSFRVYLLSNKNADPLYFHYASFNIIITSCHRGWLN